MLGQFLDPLHQRYRMEVARAGSTTGSAGHGFEVVLNRRVCGDHHLQRRLLRGSRGSGLDRGGRARARIAAWWRRNVAGPAVGVVVAIDRGVRRRGRARAWRWNRATPRVAGSSAPGNPVLTLQMAQARVKCRHNHEGGVFLSQLSPMLGQPALAHVTGVVAHDLAGVGQSRAWSARAPGSVRLGGDSASGDALLRVPGTNFGAGNGIEDDDHDLSFKKPAAVD